MHFPTGWKPNIPYGDRIGFKAIPEGFDVTGDWG